MLTTDTTYGRLQSELDQDPDSPARQLIADWFDDQGDLERAAAWRWMSEWGRRSMYYHRTGNTNHWHWWRLLFSDKWVLRVADTLPIQLWVYIEGTDEDYPEQVKSYFSRQEADEAMVKGFLVALSKGEDPTSW